MIANSENNIEHTVITIFIILLELLPENSNAGGTLAGTVFTVVCIGMSFLVINELFTLFFCSSFSDLASPVRVMLLALVEWSYPTRDETLVSA